MNGIEIIVSRETLEQITNVIHDMLRNEANVQFKINVEDKQFRITPHAAGVSVDL